MTKREFAAKNNNLIKYQKFSLLNRLAKMVFTQSVQLGNEEGRLELGRMIRGVELK